jgi:transcription elongation factor Elf1
MNIGFIEMRIKTITRQHRRDFWADYECEHCGFIENKSGYDDANFHKTVIPTMTCKKCGKKSDESYRPLTTKYPEGYQI